MTPLYSDTSISKLWAGISKASDDECWSWNPWPCIHVRRKGRKQNTTPRRMSFELAHGETSESLKITDNCGNKRCCNPKHLFSQVCRFDDAAYVERLKERFWARVDKTPGLGPNGDCWLWTGAAFHKGYGAINVRWKKSKTGNPQNEYAHRLSYEWARGPIPEGKLVCHKCDTPSCVNPNHLFVSTSFGNYFDAVMKGRMRYANKTGRERKMKPTKPPGPVRVKITQEQGAMFKQARLAKSLSIYDIAGMLEIDFTHYFRAEQGTRGLRIEHVHFLLRFFNIDEQEFELSPEQYFEHRGRPKKDRTVYELQPAA